MAKRKKKPSRPSVSLKSKTPKGHLSDAEINQLIGLVRRAHPSQLEKIQKKMPVDVDTLISDERVQEELGLEATNLVIANSNPLAQLRIMRYHLYNNW